MEQHVKPYVVERCTGAIREQMAKRYGVTSQDLADLGGFESFVYEAIIDGTPTIIKLSHEDRRTLDTLHAEAEFTRYLADHGISVSSALMSPQGNLVEAIDDGVDSRFMAVAWTIAPGVLPDVKPTDHDFWHAHGSLLGQSHAATVNYRPSSRARTRPQWDDPVNLADSRHIPKTDLKATEEVERLLAALRQLDRDPSAYGLVHYDAHLYNVHIDDGNLTLFDFDDCSYTWFVNDIAVVLYHSLMSHDDPAADAALIWPAFLAGYLSAYDLEPKWFAHIPLLLSWRDHLLYSVLCRSRDSIDDMDVDAWIDRFTVRHESGAPLIDYDFTSGTR
jgi:Ser/Thr protein kinase RdoA (MazF antagonist)